ncbi:hypothetical protein [Pantanalinema sp. GBBB05]|uniref:hypothetical protein n=1 Tax=Pantanalinema sp. GBBB05 TaxID=2604139 RepID=UPI001DE41B76|nr:hypothetical protein [Pantanalinema sp. GBBB05]
MSRFELEHVRQGVLCLRDTVTQESVYCIASTETVMDAIEAMEGLPSLEEVLKQIGYAEVSPGVWELPD